MLQKELSKRLRDRYDTKMDGNGWLEVSSDGIPLCRIKYNGQFLSNADQNLSDEYRSKIADIQDEISISAGCTIILPSAAASPETNPIGYMARTMSIASA